MKMPKANVLCLSLLLLAWAKPAAAQEPLPYPKTIEASDAPPVVFNPPSHAATDRPYPINLPTALQLSHAQNRDVALASQRIQLAMAQHERAKVLWLPTIYWGGDYFRHDGQIQSVEGRIFGTSKSTLMA